MNKKPRLTDEELSRVLGQAAIGKLNHSIWGSSDHDAFEGCGCVAGAAEALGSTSPPDVPLEVWRRIVDISMAASGPRDYGGDPDSVLRFLEGRGLA